MRVQRLSTRRGTAESARSRKRPRKIASPTSRPGWGEGGSLDRILPPPLPVQPRPLRSVESRSIWCYFRLPPSTPALRRRAPRLLPTLTAPASDHPDREDARARDQDEDQDRRRPPDQPRSGGRRSPKWTPPSPNHRSPASHRSTWNNRSSRLQPPLYRKLERAGSREGDRESRAPSRPPAHPASCGARACVRRAIPCASVRP